MQVEVPWRPSESPAVPSFANSGNDGEIPGNPGPTTSKPATSMRDDALPQDIVMRDAKPSAVDPPNRPHHPTGKAMEWESEPSDDEEDTGQRFRRRDPVLTPVPCQPLPLHAPPAAMLTRSPEATTSRAVRAPPAAVANRSPEDATPSAVLEPTAATTPPAMTPRSSPLSAALGMSPGTIGQLLDQIPAGVEELIWAAPERWNPDGLVSPPQDATDGRERSPVHASQDPPESERYPLPDGWEHNLPDHRVPAVVWRTISARLAAAQYARQRLRVRTEDGSYQITLRPSGRGTVSFVPRSREGM
ncbi:nascent polypeptide-associated complex subunit alpha, muscle-specific form-like [Drosophila kikkawai]|uniref:Nascent polypeptide-associated complex subunit alpha, muscle-specific form-like n=1 Tax=Drosophila kikkawai TaxID=30033 RepID=A0ABM4GGQ8_DROKI